MRKAEFLVWIGLVLIWMAACTPTGGINPATSEALATEAGGPAEIGPVIVLRRSGGFAGVEQEWQIYSDGRVEARQGNQPADVVQVPAEEVEALLQWMDANGFFAASIATPNPDELCCDRFLFELSASYQGKRNTVTVLDTPENLPPELVESFRRTLELLGVNFLDA